MKLTKKKRLLHKKANKPGSKASVEETIQWYDEEIKKNPTDTGLYYAKASVLAKEGRYEGALLTLDRITELDPENEKVWFIKANILFVLHRYKDAIGCFDKILEITEKDERVWYHKGKTLSKIERYKEAIECFDKAIELDSNYTEAWLGRGEALRKLRFGDIEEEPENLDEERTEELEDALDSFTKGIDLNPNSEQAWLGKGIVLHELGNYKEALPCYEKCIEINPQFINGWYRKGKALQKLGRKKEAIRTFENIDEILPKESSMEDPESWAAKANSLYELGRYEEALKCFDKILEKYPGNSYALEGKGSMLEKLGRKEEAKQWYLKSIEKNSERMSPRIRIGDIYSNEGNYDAAIKAYNAVVQMEPKFEDGWYRIGELLRKQHNHEKAKECFAWVIKINPDNVKAREALSTLGMDNKDIPEESPRIVRKIKKVARNAKLRNVSGAESGASRKMQEENPSVNLLLTNDEIEAYTIESQELQGLQALQALPAQETGYLVQSDNKESYSVEIRDHPSQIMIKGIKHMNEGEFEKALECFDQALKLNPRYYDAWNAKGDLFLKMGKIEEACICFEKVMTSMLEPNEQSVECEDSIEANKGDVWRNTIISFLEDIDLHAEEAAGPSFRCPKCDSRVVLEEKKCSACGTIFLEEDFKNECKYIDDDLVFFHKLNVALDSKKPIFLHLDNENGLIRYLEKRKNKITDQTDYVIIKGDIEKLGWDYSSERKSVAQIVDNTAGKKIWFENFLKLMSRQRGHI